MLICDQHFSLRLMGTDRANGPQFVPPYRRHAILSSEATLTDKEKAFGFHFLLALNLYPQHPYGLYHRIGRESQGLCEPGKTAVYEAIEHLIKIGLIVPIQRPQFHPALERKHYKITVLGSMVFARHI